MKVECEHVFFHSPRDCALSLVQMRVVNVTVKGVYVQLGLRSLTEHACKMWVCSLCVYMCMWVAFVYPCGEGEEEGRKVCVLIFIFSCRSTYARCLSHVPSVGSTVQMRGVTPECCIQEVTISNRRYLFMVLWCVTEIYQYSSHVLFAVTSLLDKCYTIHTYMYMFKFYLVIPVFCLDLLVVCLMFVIHAIRYTNITTVLVLSCTCYI